MKMKMNMLIGKKQIVLSALVLALGIAVYLNWEYSKVGDEFTLTNQLDGQVEQVDGDIDVESYGEAYFAEAKLSRSKSRDEAVETLSTMLADADLTGDQKAELALEAAALAKSIETEGKIENLIKAKGFTECMVYYDTDKVDIVVKAVDGLQDDQVSQMQEVILSEVEIPSENIRIIEVK